MPLLPPRAGMTAAMEDSLAMFADLHFRLPEWLFEQVAQVIGPHDFCYALGCVRLVVGIGCVPNGGLEAVVGQVPNGGRD